MNAIELVLSIPEIKSEHPRLYSQALGELETMKGQSARIAELEARVKELEAGLGQMTDEFRMDDHNLHYPRCNCQSHQNYYAARAMLAGKE